MLGGATEMTPNMFSRLRCRSVAHWHPPPPAKNNSGGQGLAGEHFLAGGGGCQGATERHRERATIFGVVSVAPPSIAPAAEATERPAPDF